MKKQISILALALILSGLMQAQAPQAIRYQGVARDNTGATLNNKNISVRLGIRDGSPSGTVVYLELHNLTTNQFGLYNLSIGQGNVQTGTFAGINWSSGSKYLEQEVDFGSGFQSMGVSQLQSVPYALFAGNVSGGANPWLEGGNALTATGLFGSSSAQHVDLTTNGIVRGRMTINGQFNWGTTTPSVTGAMGNFNATTSLPYALNAYAGAGTTGAFVAINGPNNSNTSQPAVFGNHLGSGTGSGIHGQYGGTSTNTVVAATQGIYTGSISSSGGFGVLGYNSADYSGNYNRTGLFGIYSSNLAFGIGCIGIGYGGSFPSSSNDFGMTGWVGNNLQYSGYFNGDFVVANGGKSASVPTSKGNQLLYCAESPEVWFEDLGGGQLVNGEAVIQLDPLFLETVVIDNNHPMRVFVQMEGESEEVFVTKTTTSFKVKERNHGNSNAAFSYRVMAKRVHFQDHRFGNDPVWGAGDTRKYSKYSTPPSIDYNENLSIQAKKRSEAANDPVPPGFVKGSQITKELDQRAAQTGR